MTSGTDPCLYAITGVPQASASIITMPNGSGQSIGKINAPALPRNSPFSPSPISPMNSTSGWSSSGWIVVSKYSTSILSTFAAILIGTPRRFATSIARSTRFSGEIRPRNAK